MLDRLAETVQTPMELVLVLRAPQHQARREHGDESVPLDQLRGAVAHEHAGERYDAGLRSGEGVVARNGEDDLAEQPAERGAGRCADRDAIDDVDGEPLEGPAAGREAVHGYREPEQDEGERKAIVEAGLGRECEPYRLLATLERRADLEIAREHRIRRRQDRCEQDGAGQSQPGDRPADPSERQYGERQHEDEQPPRRPPVGCRDVVDPEPRAEQRDDDGQLGRDFPDSR